MNKIVLIFLIIAGSLAGLYFFNKAASKSSLPDAKSISPSPTSIEFLIPTNAQKIDYQAGFAIFTNGLFRVFTAAMYYHRSEGAFIEAKNPNIVNVKKAGITWGDFFNTLPFKLTRDCLTTGTKETFCSNEKGQLSFYLNGVKRDNLLDLKIKEADRALITYGKSTPEEIEKQMQQVPVP